MTPTAIRTLARVLWHLLPSAVVDPSGAGPGAPGSGPGQAPSGGDPEAARTLAERLDAALETAGVEQPHVAIISDSLVGFLTGWSTRYGNLGEEVERGVGVLCLAVTGRPDLLPGGATLEEGHIAQLLSWALLEELDDTP